MVVAIQHGGAFKEMLLQPLQNVFQELVNADLLHRLTRHASPNHKATRSETHGRDRKKMVNLLREAKRLTGEEKMRRPLPGAKTKTGSHLILTHYYKPLSAASAKGSEGSSRIPDKKLTDSTYMWSTLFNWLFVHSLGKVVNPIDFEGQSRM